MAEQGGREGRACGEAVGGGKPLGASCVNGINVVVLENALGLASVLGAVLLRGGCL